MRGAGYYFRESDYMCVVWTTDRRGAWWIDDGDRQLMELSVLRLDV
jgi:hypothetical protein